MSLTDERILEILDTVEPGCGRLPLGWKLFAKAIEAEVTKPHPFTCICDECCATKPQEPIGYDDIFNAIAEAASPCGEGIGVSVMAFKRVIGGEIYTTPQHCQRCAGKDQLIAEQNKLGKERQEWALKNAETIRELKTKCADLEQMHADICEIADDYRGKWLDLEALVTVENQKRQQLEAEVEKFETDFNAQEIRTHAIRQERDALAIVIQKLRDALESLTHVEYALDLPLLQLRAIEALTLPDTSEIIKRHDAAIRDEMIDLFRLKHRDYANEIAAELEGKS